jgi:hypothetical protein
MRLFHDLHVCRVHMWPWCRLGRHVVTPVYASLANLDPSVSKTQRARTLVGLIEYPPWRTGDTEWRYQLTWREILHKCVETLLDTLNEYRLGFPLLLRTGLAQVYPKVGLIVADTPEQRNLFGIHGHYSVRCDAHIYRPGATTSNGTEPQFVATGGDDPLANAGRDGIDVNLHDLAPVDAPCSAVPEFYQSDVRHAGLFRNAVILLVTASQQPSVVVTRCVCVQCKPRDPAVRSGLLATMGSWDQCPVLGEAFEAYAEAGVQPFIHVAFDKPKYRFIMGALPAVDHLVGDALHVVRVGLPAAWCSSGSVTACSCARVWLPLSIAAG